MTRKLCPARYAHRGLYGLPEVPENSMAAFRRAAEQGFGIELDVHLLRDGSLAVFHDSTLERCAGVPGVLEDLTREEAEKLHLNGTEETVPFLEQVLAAVNGAVPMIVEIKTYKGNHRAVTEAVCRVLDGYRGAFAVKSFDPYAVRDVRILRPAFIRGQLSRDFVKKPFGVPRLMGWALKNLLFNCLTKPDFVSYCYEDRHAAALKRWRKKGGQTVYWTVHSRTELETALQEGAIPIFEHFIPDGNR